MKKKILGILLVVFCIVLVVINWPRKLSQLIPLSGVSQISVLWAEEPFSGNEERKEVELTSEKMDSFLEYWEGLTLQPTSPKDDTVMKLPVYHVYFMTGSEHIGMRISAEGIAEIDGKFYSIKPWNAESSTILNEFMLSLQ